MKYILVLSILSLSAVFEAGIQFDMQLKTELDVGAQQFSHLVGRRFYFINRLTPIMNDLVKIDEYFQEQVVLQYEEQVNIHPLTSRKYQHPAITTRVNSTSNYEKTLRPLFLIWNDFIQFRYLQDQLFVEEFTQEIFVVACNLLTISLKRNPELADLRKIHSPTAGFNADTATLINLIEIYLKTFLDQNPKITRSDYSQKNLTDLQPFVTIDEVIFHYYYLKRMIIPLEMLNKIIQYNIKPNELSLDLPPSTHFHITRLIDEMRIQNSFEPLMHFHMQLRQYKYINEKELIKEFSLLNYTLLNAIAAKLNGEVSPTKIPDHPHIQASLQDIPLEDLLDAITIISKELPPLLDKYALTSSLGWKEWFQKYWWAPPIVIATIAIKILLNHQKRHAHKPA